ncbi:radical SAM protein [Glacieibacterium frigidum]|uniref:Radical SAM protein n=1 Tax=Glacieibacterium frigidum TaxID=2593303 RepID=A0A552U9G4_9SPHN|nr:radical SAM protein [Glacieibacterium frigidum]TRW14829.1 radical SAM protein [Glacieibacterium frigidum]
MTVRFAQIEPTTRCNFTCGFCAGRHMAQGDLAFETFAAFLSAHPALTHVELQGEGEPLLHPRIFDMIATCGERGIAVSMIVNGSLLSETRIARLVEGGVRTIHVSLETVDPARFAAIRGGLFDKVADGIQRLVDARNRLGAAYPAVGLAVTLLASTIADAPAIAQFYDDLGLDGGIVWQGLQAMPAYADHYDAGVAAEALTPALWQRHHGELVRTLGARGGRAPSFYHAMFAAGRPGGCAWLDGGAYLAIDGRVSGCCYMKAPADAFGRIGDDTVATIDAARDALAQALARGVVPPPCRGCAIAARAAASPSAAPPRPLPRSTSPGR